MGSRGASLARSAQDRVRDCVAGGEVLLEGETETLCRTRAVRDPVLLLLGQLGHRLVGAFDEEERIVSEPAGAARSPRDASFARPFDDERLKLSTCTSGLAHLRVTNSFISASP